MKKVTILLSTLILTSGCTFSEDYASAYAICIDDYEAGKSRWQRGYQNEVYIRGIGQIDYCTQWSQEMVQNLRRMGFDDR